MAANGQVTTLVGLEGLRPAAAAVLAPENEADPPVHIDVVDSLDPPALMLTWDEPWLAVGASERATMGPCLWTARLAVMCIAARLEPGPGVTKLEQLVDYAISRFRADTYSWPFAGCTAPRVVEIAGVRYLAARLTYAVPVTI